MATERVTENNGIPVNNPLNCSSWPHNSYPNASEKLLELAALTSGITAVWQILRNNEELAEENRESPESSAIKPLNGFLVGGLQAALSTMSFSASGIAWDLLEKEQKRHDQASAQS